VAVSGCDNKRESEAVGVVRGFVGDVSTGRPVRAYGRTSHRYRASIAAEDFAAFVRESVFLQEASGFRPEVVAVIEGGYRIEGALVTGGGEVPVTAVVISDRGAWRLDQLAAPGERLLPSATERAAPRDAPGSR
jgi:hypothetical protein